VVLANLIVKCVVLNKVRSRSERGVVMSCSRSLLSLSLCLSLCRCVCLILSQKHLTTLLVCGLPRRRGPVLFYSLSLSFPFFLSHSVSLSLPLSLCIRECVSFSHRSIGKIYLCVGYRRGSGTFFSILSLSLSHSFSLPPPLSLSLAVSLSLSLSLCKLVYVSSSHRRI